jgi:hypothetical protein
MVTDSAMTACFYRVVSLLAPRGYQNASKTDGFPERRPHRSSRVIVPRKADARAGIICESEDKGCTPPHQGNVQAGCVIDPAAWCKASPAPCPHHPKERQAALGAEGTLGAWLLLAASVGSAHAPSTRECHSTWPVLEGATWVAGRHP